MSLSNASFFTNPTCDSATFPLRSISNGPAFFTAVEEQLGLKLDLQTGPVDVLVIDHVEKPTP